MASRYDELLLKRSQAWRKESGPYLRYMAQSGFPGFVALVAMTGIISYIGFLREVPAETPIAAIGVALLLPLLSWTPLRSYLVQADIVFLMPRESEMGGYLLAARIRGTLFAAMLLLAAFAGYAPLYRHSEQAGASWPWLALVLIGLKLASSLGAWHERRMAWPGARRAFRLLRWAAGALALSALLTQPLLEASLISLLAASALAAAYRLPAKHLVPWERLIAEESATRQRYYRFFGSFIDVKATEATVARRSYWSWLADMLPHARGQAFAYLYAKSLLRTELGGMLLRLTLLGMLVAYLTARSLAASGWAAVGTAWLFALVIGVQLGALRHVHRYSVWRHVYPLPDDARLQGLLRVVRAALTGACMLLTLAAAIPLTFAGMHAQAVTAAAGLLVYALWLAPARLRGKLSREELED